jgi:hypothetical protein
MDEHQEDILYILGVLRFDQAEVDKAICASQRR